MPAGVTRGLGILLIYYSPALEAFILGTYYKISLSLAVKNIRIPEVRGIALCLLGQYNLILADSPISHQSPQTLGRSAMAIFILGIAGIKHPQLAIFPEAATGVAAILVMAVCWPHGQLRHGIVYQILGLYMGPAFILVLAAQGIPLIENMVFAVYISKSVGVVDKAKGHF